MTQEEKQLLLKDLCARLPYGVICMLSVKDTNVSITEKLVLDGLELFILGTIEAKPYLRPMSSMTKEEWQEYDDFCDSYRGEGFYELIDWLNEKHFDYRGLIEKGLALKVPEGMYKEITK